MGLFGWVGRAASSVASGVKKAASATYNVAKNVATKTVEATKKVCTKVKETATNMWGKFSGKEDFEKAEKLYNQIKERYESKERYYKQEVDKIVNRIEKHVNVINSYKGRIKTELFVEMAQKLEKIKGIQFDRDFRLEDFTYKEVNFDTVRSKNQLYTIDFNKNKFKTSALAIFTLGFATRKKAKETLAAVQEEEAKVNHEMAKMDSELVKLNAIAESLSNVENYFSSLIPIYEQLLIRLDNNVNFLYFQCMQFAQKLISKEMKLNRLPVAQQKEVEAIITASKILRTMTDTQFVSVSDVNQMKTYESEMKLQKVEMDRAYAAA